MRTTCQASGCYNQPMPVSRDNPKGLCGCCHEKDEDFPVRLKPGPTSVGLEAIQKRNETRALNQVEKKRLRAEHINAILDEKRSRSLA